VLWVLGFQGLGFYLLLWEFYIGVSSGFVELFSLVLYKNWFLVASYYEFYRVMGFIGIS
jgi:hypothetical protein